MSRAETEKQPGDVEMLGELAGACASIRSQLGRRIVGQENVIDQMLIALFTGGHSLLVGVPGLAKTLLVSTMAEVLDLDFKRVQFTPDLMPADILGTEVLVEDRSTGDRRFRFSPGPVFTNLLLADEINRTPPKTQAALLQVMQEKAVSVGGVTHRLEEPYLVLATQNPIEQEGTYPLPEAELDRFMLFIDVGYPSGEQEVEIAMSTTGESLPAVEKVLGPERIRDLQKLVRRVPVARPVADYAVRLARATRPGTAEATDLVNRYVSWGAGPRASQFLILAAKARAAFDGRFAANAQDVRELALPVLRHRVIPNFQAEVAGIGVLDILSDVLDKTRP
ncbi:MAG: MoxR family ATPase [Deltaproteobacteria bacterium]|nr:MAG: MoxR family ATPase [Deltaproteobacteria bacterium]